VEVETPLKVV
jgi:hypothetical protein